MDEYPRTKASVEKLLDLLTCDNCNRTLHEPYTNGVCIHTLCYDCCTNSVAATGSRSKKHAGIGKICPICFVPIRPCDVKPHPGLHNLVLVTRRLAKLLGSIEPSLDSGASALTKGTYFDFAFTSSGLAFGRSTLLITGKISKLLSIAKYTFARVCACTPWAASTTRTAPSQAAKERETS